MLVLAIDTTSTACSLALVETTGNASVQARIVEPMARGHAEALMPLLTRTFEDAGAGISDVDRIAVAIGPGSFTGLRVGISAARGLALASEKPCVGVDLFAVIRTMHGVHDGPLSVALDARRDEVYLQTFLPSAGAAQGPSVVPVVEARNSLDISHRVVGTGAALLGRSSPPMLPVDPVALAKCGAILEPEKHPPNPLYLRRPDAKPQAHAAVARA